MGIGLIIIGDEILSGKRIDQHFSKVVELLAARDLQLSWAEYLGDDRSRITATLKRTFANDDTVFSCGGIGATPDDHTRQCAAAAFGVQLTLHPEAKKKIQERITDTARETGKIVDLNSFDNLHRLKMGEFPEGALIIPNPYNKIPGFSVIHHEKAAHHFVPGFPVMAWPMIEWVLDKYSNQLEKVSISEKSVLVFNEMESTLTPLMESLEHEFASIKVFSLPHIDNTATRRHIELGVKGDPSEVPTAFERMIEGLNKLKAEYQQV